MAPGLLAVAPQEIGKARSQVAADMPHENCDRIACPAVRLRELFVSNLRQCTFAERLVPAKLADDGRENRCHLSVSHPSHPLHPGTPRTYCTPRTSRTDRATSFIAPFAAATVFLMSRSV